MGGVPPMARVGNLRSARRSKGGLRLRRRGGRQTVSAATGGLARQHKLHPRRFTELTSPGRRKPVQRFPSREPRLGARRAGAVSLPPTSSFLTTQIAMEIEVIVRPSESLRHVDMRSREDSPDEPTKCSGWGTRSFAEYWQSRRFRISHARDHAFGHDREPVLPKDNATQKGIFPAP